MTELILTIWLASGAVIREPTNWSDCRELYGVARYTDAIGGAIEREGHGLIVRMSCGGHDIVLALPPSDAPCEMEPAA